MSVDLYTFNICITYFGYILSKPSYSTFPVFNCFLFAARIKYPGLPTYSMYPMNLLIWIRWERDRPYGISINMYTYTRSHPM